MKTYRIIKRALDFIFALFLILLLFIPLCFIALFIKMDTPGPVFFMQNRLGFKGRVYRIIKFRSMYVDSENKGSGVYSYKGDPRITRVGKFLRSTSIDELPQLINIIKGEMSFVGPRPALTYHPWPFDQYTDHQKIMFDVLPGITGWAQVHGRKDVPWPERIKLNIWYVNNMSFLLDLKIIVLTVFKVIRNSDNENKRKTV